jgi:DNA-binding transcriptional LysR family regulator
MNEEAGQPFDLRRLRYFVAVAEELHFGRAALRLFIAQPVLSRHVRKLEVELSTQLFIRDSHNVALTPAGERLLVEGRQLLAAADAARRRMHGAAIGEQTLTVGFFVGDYFTPALVAFTEKRPEVTVAFLRIYWHDQTEVLHNGRVDAAFIHGPVDRTDLELLPVRAEPRVAVLATTHRLAGRSKVGIEELADDPVIEQHGASPAWEAFHNVDPRPDGSSPRRGPSVDNIEEKLQHVAAGRAISFLPASAAAAVVHSGVVYVPVSDIAPIQISLAWVAGRRSGVVQDFVETVAHSTRSVTERARSTRPI